MDASCARSKMAGGQVGSGLWLIRRSWPFLPSQRKGQVLSRTWTCACCNYVSIPWRPNKRPQDWSRHQRNISHLKRHPTHITPTQPIHNKQWKTHANTPPTKKPHHQQNIYTTNQSQPWTHTTTQPETKHPSSPIPQPAINEKPNTTTTNTIMQD